MLAFGVVRGLVSTGPARGTRLAIVVDPPLDERSHGLALRAVHERLDDEVSAVGPRILATADGVVAEVPEQDPEMVDQIVALIERTAKLEIRSGGRTLPASAIVEARSELGVTIEVADPAALAGFAVGTRVDVIFDGKPKYTGAPDRIQGTELHLPVTDIRDAIDLAAAIEAGATPPMHVVRRDAFERATGFLPRAWPFLAIAGVLLVIAAVLWLRRS